MVIRRTTAAPYPSISFRIAVPAAGQLHHNPLGLILEDEDEGAGQESDSDGSEEGEQEEHGGDAATTSGAASGGGGGAPAVVPIRFTAADIPQAFSHFTYAYTRRKMLVCDLQGVLDEAASPPVFELTDPVIHYSSTSGRRQVFGRSDRGKKGVSSFFRTHECSELCNAVRRTAWVVPAPRSRQQQQQQEGAAAAAGAAGAGGGASSSAMPASATEILASAFASPLFSVSGGGGGSSSSGCGAGGGGSAAAAVAPATAGAAAPAGAAGA